MATIISLTLYTFAINNFDRAHARVHNLPPAEGLANCLFTFHSSFLLYIVLHCLELKNTFYGLWLISWFC